jgi:single-strand DNA-binding protein
MNILIIDGRLTADPVLKQTQSGTALCKFSIANNQWNKSKNEKEAHFFNVTAWGKTAENIVQYFKKGSPIAVEGKIVQNRWEAEDGQKRQAVEIQLYQFTFMGGKPEDSPAKVKLEDKPESKPVENSPFSDDDELCPF